MKRLALCCAMLSLAASALPAAGPAATWSFSTGDRATCPRTVTVAPGKIVVDLSAVPAEAKVFRAVLRPMRTGGPGWQREDEKVVIVPAGEAGKPLQLLGPRYTSLDATAAVTSARAAGRKKLELLVKSLGGLDGKNPDRVRLDVWLAGAKTKAKVKLPAVTALAARHRNGQTLLSWTQPAAGIDQAELTVAEWRALRAKPSAGMKLRYRIYRGGGPITAETIAKADLVDEVGALTCWNPDYYGIYPDKKRKLPRYVVAGGGKPVAPATGIYAHNPAKAGKACYAVTVVVDGAEDFSTLGEGSALARPVDETVGPGDPVLQKIAKPEKFFYTAGVTLHFYTRWEAPPRCNLPSRPYDYVVIVPAKPAEPAPLNLILHCWGSNFLGKGGAFSWHGWRDKARGIGVASNQIPYDWWTCYHENRGTWKPWTEGVSRDFTAKRLLAFVDFVAGKWPVDATRLVVSGESMGGSGSTFIPIRHAGRFAYAYSSVGIHNPAAIKGSGFHESYARCVGRMGLGLKHESGMKVWDYLNDAALVRARPKASLPFIGFGNGKNDHGIGWAHAVDLKNALQQARQPHAVVWNLRGHGAGTFYPPMDFCSAQSLPAFTKCSLDGDMGTATKLAEPKPFKHSWGQVSKDVYDGDPVGGVNIHLRWETATIVDEPGRWEITVYRAGGKGGAPTDACSVNITPRRLQKLTIKPGETFTWTNVQGSRLAGAVGGGKEVQSGKTVADEHGLVTMEKVSVTKGRNRIKLVRAR